MARGKPKARQIARYLFLDSKLTVKFIAYLLNLPQVTIYKWQERDKWGDELGISLDDSLYDTKINVRYLINFLKKKAYKESFDEHYIQLTSALKRLSDVHAILLDDAPFSSEKSQIEGVDKFKQWIEGLNLQPNELKIVMKYIDMYFMESLSPDESKAKTI